MEVAFKKNIINNENKNLLSEQVNETKLEILNLPS